MWCGQKLQDNIKIILFILAGKNSKDSTVTGKLIVALSYVNNANNDSYN